MITRGCFFLALMVNYVLSLPVSSRHIEKEDAKVMKCIVEVIADALSKPDPIPVSQNCLDSLRTDDRLISILRRQNFLKELQEISIQGANERALNEDGMDPVIDRFGGPTTLEDSPDQSMLAFLESSEEMPVTSEKREREDESMEDEGKEEPDKPVSNVPSEEEARASLEDHAVKEEDGNDRGGEVKSGGKTELAKITAEVKSQEKEQAEAEEGVRKAAEDRRDFGELEKRKEEEEGEEEEMELKHLGEMDDLTEGPSSRRHAEAELGGGATDGIPHHSKEEDGREEEARRSPEALELQMMARREMEEGSAIRRAEDHEVDRLAAIESELENMADQLHELRTG
ncbi:hypothetical protein SKAU_G00190930 [Synaphobranchus kaupii]|uniref:Chromogranin-A n=1 Tax=Synaphobranchus kaupii TaxID=118154 RepID=A0A9Q1FDN5_SYNKA|nr:hypothetical protein SKAU_G00190930 [Synaphobranchus kaupii]